MTVKELIARLETMPKDSEIIIETITLESSTATKEINDIFETLDNEIVIQGYNY